MAGSVNKVILVGNLGKDPEVRSFQNGGRVCNFSIATSESWKDKTSGERKEKTEWHRISISNDKLVEVAEKYLRKGSKVYIEGQLETRKWTDKDGKEQYTTEVMVKPFRGELTLLDSKKDGDAGHGGETHDTSESSLAGYVRPPPTGRGDPQRNYAQGQRPADDRRPATDEDKRDLDDEIPF